MAAPHEVKLDIDEVERSEKHLEGGAVDAPTQKERDAYIRKLDLHIMPVIFVIYMLSVLDRSNLGNAHQANLDDGIGLVGNQYNLVGTIFYIGCKSSLSRSLSACLRNTLWLLTNRHTHRHHLDVDGSRLETLSCAHLVRMHRCRLVYSLHPPSLRPKFLGPRCHPILPRRFRSHVRRRARVPLLFLPATHGRFPTGHLY